MNLRDLVQDFDEKRTAYEGLRDGKAEIAEIRSAMEAMKAAKELVDMEKENQAINVDIVPDERTTQKQDKVEIRNMSLEDVEKKYTKVFLKSLRGKKLNSEDIQVYNRVAELRAVPTSDPYLESNTAADGGLLIPSDIQTKINYYKRLYAFELQSLVTTETVSVRSGSRVFEKLADALPWTAIDEWDTIIEHETPQWEQKSFTVKDYAGIIPIPNRMLEDTDAALMDAIARYIARKTIITRNAQILTLINTTYAVKTALADVDDFKDILNVTLDAVFANNAAIVTNQDGFNFLDKLKDENGVYLLQPDVKSPTGKALLGKSVVLVPNRELPSYTAPVTGKVTAPVFIGDLKEAIVFFDRGTYEIRSTDIGGNAFTRNSTDFRVIDRFSVHAFDTAAVVAGELTIVAGV